MPRGQAAADLFAQERTDGVANQAVDDAPRLLGIDAVHVDTARVLHRREHGAFGDFVELDAADLLVTVQPEGGQQMPGDGFAFAIGVGR